MRRLPAHLDDKINQLLAHGKNNLKNFALIIQPSGEAVTSQGFFHWNENYVCVT
jgi:hypothetical protein